MWHRLFATNWYHYFMKTFLDSVIATLRKAADDAGSIRKLAERCGVNAVTLSRWLSGDRNPTVVEVSKIFDTLGVSFYCDAQQEQS